MSSGWTEGEIPPWLVTGYGGYPDPLSQLQYAIENPNVTITTEDLGPQCRRCGARIRRRRSRPTGRKYWVHRWPRLHRAKLATRRGR